MNIKIENLLVEENWSKESARRMSEYYKTSIIWYDTLNGWKKSVKISEIEPQSYLTAQNKFQIIQKTQIHKPF